MVEFKRPSLHGLGAHTAPALAAITHRSPKQFKSHLGDIRLWRSVDVGSARNTAKGLRLRASDQAWRQGVHWLEKQVNNLPDPPRVLRAVAQALHGDSAKSPSIIRRIVEEFKRVVKRARDTGLEVKRSFYKQFAKTKTWYGLSLPADLKAFSQLREPMRIIEQWLPVHHLLRSLDLSVEFLPSIKGADGEDVIAQLVSRERQLRDINDPALSLLPNQVRQLLLGILRKGEKALVGEKHRLEFSIEHRDRWVHTFIHEFAHVLDELTFNRKLHVSLCSGFVDVGSFGDAAKAARQIVEKAKESAGMQALLAELKSMKQHSVSDRSRKLKYLTSDQELFARVIETVLVHQYGNGKMKKALNDHIELDEDRHLAYWGEDELQQLIPLVDQYRKALIQGLMGDKSWN